MKLRIASDIHTEMHDSNNKEKLKRVIERFVLPPMEDDEEQVLLLAGDIGSAHKPDNLRYFLDLVRPRFRNVVNIGGNHEGYGESISTTNERHITIFPNESPLLTTTLWTDFNKEDPIIMKFIENSLNDYRYVHQPNSKELITSEFILNEHKKSRNFLERAVTVGSIVMTHHAPSEKSVNSQYEGSLLTYGFFSDLEEFILEKKPKLWIHGHMHNSSDYMIGDTRVICNPFGYPNEHRYGKKYNPKLVVEV